MTDENHAHAPSRENARLVYPDVWAKLIAVVFADIARVDRRNARRTEVDASDASCHALVTQ